MVSLKLIAADLLFGCPGYAEEYADKELSQDIYVAGEITEKPLVFKQPVHLYASPNNPGACEVADVLQNAMQGLALSTDPPPAATAFLLYLAYETFSGELGEQLAAELLDAPLNA